MPERREKGNGMMIHCYSLLSNSEIPLLLKSKGVPLSLQDGVPLSLQNTLNLCLRGQRILNASRQAKGMSIHLRAHLSAERQEVGACAEEAGVYEKKGVV